MASLGVSCIDAYMEQWLKTATKGNVRFAMAFLTNRMHLHCDVCNIGLTCEKPVDAQTIDFAVQEYVKLHAHKGGFGDEWKCEMCGVWTKEPLTGPSGHGTSCKTLVTNPDPCSHKKNDGGSALIKHQMPNGDPWVRCGRCGAQMKPVSVDFKDLPSFKPLPMASGGQSAVIDENPKNVAKIYDAMAQYDKKKQLQLLELQEVQAKILWAKSQLNNPIDLWKKTVIEHVPPPKPAAPVNDVFEDKGRKFR